MNKSISVIIPTFNDSKNIIKAIDSILLQSFKDFEIIVVDDGSEDETKNVLKPYIESNKITYIYQNNKGVNSARNYGVSIANGSYVALLDSDDEWIDIEKLKVQKDFLDNNPDHILVGTGVILVDAIGREITRYLMAKTDKEIREKLLRINCFVNSSILFKKSVIDVVGVSCSILEDYDLWLRMGNIGKMANLERYSVKYCLKTSGVNTDKKFLRLKENLYLAKKYKDKYPGYGKAFILGYIKIFFYQFFALLPVNLSGFFLKIHKKL